MILDLQSLEVDMLSLEVNMPTFFLGSMGKEKGDNMVNMSTFGAG